MIVTSSTTVSHRYYRRKRKADLYRLIGGLSRSAGVDVPDDAVLRREDRDRLATRCMALHALLPDDEG